MYEELERLRKIYEFRSSFINTIREYFVSQGVVEVDTPIMTPYFSHDLNISPLKTEYLNKTYYLATSPEFFLKRILASRIGDIFEITHAFRNDPITPLHNPEFLLLEWYRVGWRYLDLVKDLKGLLALLSKRFRKRERYVEGEWEILSVREVFTRYIGIELNDLLDERKRKDIALSKGYKDDDFETLFHKLFLTHIEPNLGKTKPTVIYDYPEVLGGFAVNVKGDARFTERMELYLDGMEMANGYTEITDPEEQKRRWNMYGTKEFPYDEDFLRYLNYGMPPCAGIALGLDRLMMFFLEKKKLEDVMPFSFKYFFKSGDCM